MGLSDEERIHGLYYSIDKLTELGKDTELQKSTDMLWHSFLGDESKASHWVLGTDLGVKCDSDNLWGVAIFHHTNGVMDFEDDKHTYDLKDEYFSIDKLIENKCSYDTERNKKHSKYYLIFQWAERAIYYLRRYNDEILKKYPLLNIFLSQIQGECFHQFKSCSCYARAYIINKMIDMIYSRWHPYQKNKWDKVTRWLDEKHVHFDLDRCMEMSLKELAEIHLSLHRDKSEKNKVLTIGKLMLRRLHKYKDDELMKKYIPQEMFDKAKKLYEEHEKPMPGTSDMTMYGYKYYDEK